MSSTSLSYFQQPLDAALLLRKKKSIRQELLANQNLLTKRIAVLGGSTTAEVVDQLEIFLLAQGIEPVFYQSEYNKYYEDALFPDTVLKQFKPDLVYLHTSAMNIANFAEMTDTREDVEQLLANQLLHFQSVWDGIARNLNCPIVQNNFEQPWYRPLGNLDGSDFRGRSRFVARLNELFAAEAEKRSALYIHDIHHLSARVGVDNWFSPRMWYLYKYAMDMEMIPCLAHNLASVIAALWGRVHKCLVLDLDNTLWGGVIGDDGLHGISVGSETAEAEAFTDFQRYVRALKERGVILAVCSKNDDANARAGFLHPNSVLKLDDFASFRANWDPKSTNIELVASDINIGVDSLVFVDDNPAERDIVRAQISSVNVPEVGSDITEYIRILDRSALFQASSLSEEDLKRTQQYSENSRRELQQAKFASYDDFLASLAMVAEIQPFKADYIERITQLINKTNQFNLTTKRCTEAEVVQMSSNPSCITLYGRLQDKFGDNGLISVVAGEIKDEVLHINLWLMSCRVLKRGMESAMLEQLCTAAVQRHVKAIVGYYYPTPKNKMVSDLYQTLGFSKTKDLDSGTVWTLDLSNGVPEIKHCIQVAPE